MTDALTNLGTVITQMMTWMTTVLTTIVTTPILLIPFAAYVIFVVIRLVRKLMGR